MHISESELALADSKYSLKHFQQNQQYWEKIMHSLGLNTCRKYMYQPVLEHRNRLGKIVVCARFWGHEREDKEWLQSGYASREALDRARNCKMVDEFYATRGLTVFAQTAGELKDTYDTNAKAEIANRQSILDRGWLKEQQEYFADELGQVQGKGTNQQGNLHVDAAYSIMQCFEELEEEAKETK